jgi:hypothetical protein
MNQDKPSNPTVHNNNNDNNNNDDKNNDSKKNSLEAAWTRGAKNMKRSKTTIDVDDENNGNCKVSDKGGVASISTSTGRQPMKTISDLFKTAK